MPFFSSHPSLEQVKDGIRQYLTAGTSTPEATASLAVEFMAGRPVQENKLEFARFLEQAQHFQDLLELCDQIKSNQSQCTPLEVPIKAQEIFTLLQRCQTWLSDNTTEVLGKLEKASYQWHNPLTFEALQNIIDELITKLNHCGAVAWRQRFNTLGHKIRTTLSAEVPPSLWHIALLRHPLNPYFDVSSLSALEHPFKDWNTKLVKWDHDFKSHRMPTAFSYDHDTVHFLIGDAADSFRSNFSEIVQEQKWRFSFASFFLNATAHYSENDAALYAEKLPQHIKDAMELATACTGFKPKSTFNLNRSILNLSLCKIFRHPSKGYHVVLAQQGNCGLLARNPENNTIKILAAPTIDYGAIPVASIQPKVRCYQIPEGHEILLLNGETWRTLSTDRHVREHAGKGKLNLNLKALQHDFQMMEEPLLKRAASNSKPIQESTIVAADPYSAFLQHLIQKRYEKRPGFHSQIKYDKVIRPILEQYRSSVTDMPALLLHLAKTKQLEQERFLRAYLKDIGLEDGYWPNRLPILADAFPHLPHPLLSFPIIESIKISSRYEQVVRNFLSSNEPMDAFIPILGQLSPPNLAKLIQNTGPHNPEIVQAKLSRLFSYWNDQAKKQADTYAFWSTAKTIALWSLLFIIPGIWQACRTKSIYRDYYNQRYFDLTAQWRTEIGDEVTLENVRQTKRRARSVDDDEWKAATQPKESLASDEQVLDPPPEMKSYFSALGLPKSTIVDEQIEGDHPGVKQSIKVAYCLMPGKTLRWQRAKQAFSMTGDPATAKLNMHETNDINLLDKLPTAEFPEVKELHKVKL